MKNGTKTSLVLVSLLLLTWMPRADSNELTVTSPDRAHFEGGISSYHGNSNYEKTNVEETLAEQRAVYVNGSVKGGCETTQTPTPAASASVASSLHLMCKDCDRFYNPIQATTMFRPSDAKAVCLTTVWISNSIKFLWYYRSNSPNAWIECYNWTAQTAYTGEHYYAGYMLIAEHWPAMNFPRAFKVDVYLDDVYAFSEFFEVTNGGANSPRTCTELNADGTPVNIQSRFTIGTDTRISHSLTFEKVAYFNEQQGCCHNFTALWIQPNGSVYKRHSASFADYKDANITWDCWEQACDLNDNILIGPGTPTGNWRIELYVDSYFSNNSWKPYGPIAVTPFTIGDKPVADWTFMVYLNGDNSLENASIDVFMRMANVSSSPQINVIAQMDRVPGQDDKYGNWTDCKRFKIAEGMTPTPENATFSLGEVDMGDPNTLEDFINWTISNYPAVHYLLSLFDHGAGVMGFCYDETSAFSALSMPELRQALLGFPATFDILYLDACSMSMIEIAYQVRERANILVAPEGLGYAAAPYDKYLSHLIGDPSTLPEVLAEQMIIDYIRWCNDVSSMLIPNATMCAIDLTKMTTLAAAMDDFALSLEGTQTPYHEQIVAARELTTNYPGPNANESEYYVDLRHFAQMAEGNIPDYRFRTIANRLVNLVSIGNVVIFQADKDSPNSYGLSVFFPNTHEKYASYASTYERTAFATDTLWDDFLRNHLSGCLLTVEMPYYNIPVSVNGTSYSTDIYGRIHVFVQPDYYTFNVSSVVQSTPDSRGIFAQWNDSIKLNPRTVFVNQALAIRAEYETQYRMIINTNCGNTNPPTGEHWHKAGSLLEITAVAPAPITGERYTWQGWNSSIGYIDANNPATLSMIEPINRTAVWRHEYYLTVMSLHGSPVVTSGWFEAGSTITASINSPVQTSTDTRHICLGWQGAGTFPTSGTNTSAIVTLSEPASITWNWKTQYLLVALSDPVTAETEPDLSPQGPWYDSGTMVTCTAGRMSGYLFDHWTVGETNWNRGVNPVTITMDKPYEAKAYYVRALMWWESWFQPENLPIALGAIMVIIVAAVACVAWIVFRKKKAIVRVLSSEIDHTYARLRSNPRKCEEELSKLRSKILDASTEGKITEEDHGVMDRRIEACIEDLQKLKRAPPPLEEPKPEKVEAPEVVLPSRVPTGFAGLDSLLLGGLPENRAVIMASPPCDERDSIVRSFLEAGVNKGEATFYLTIDATAMKELAQEHPSNFYVFVCNPKAYETIENLPNVFRLRGVENLTDINIALTSAFRRLDTSVPKRACITIVSDVLLQHGALSARRWLATLIPELRSNLFTTLAVINPQMHPSEDTQATLDLFDGEIAIYEKETRRGMEKMLKIRRLYDQRYLETELPLKASSKKR